MSTLLICLLILAALFTVIAGICVCVKFRMKITANKKPGENPVLKVTTETVGGLFKLDLYNLINKKSQKNSTPENAAPASDSDIGNKIASYYRTFCKIKQIFLRSKRRFRKNIFVERIFMTADIGLDDAAHTGIATGVLWTGIYNVVGLISSVARLSEPEISVNPDFENEKLAFDVECIIVLRLANIISILLTVGINYLTLKNKEKAAINYDNTN